MKAFRVIAVAALALGCVGSFASAQLLNEPFAYPDGNLAGQGSWTAHSGAGVLPVQVTSGLAVLAQAGGSREDVNTLLSGTLGAGQKYYSAFDLSNSGGNGNVYFAHFKDSGTFNFAARIFITSNTLNDYTLGLSGSSSAIGATWASGLTFGTSYRVVSSYDFDTGGVELWVAPVNQGSTSITTSGTAAFAISSYALRQASPSAGTSSQTVDNLCVADNFTDALNCTPEPATLALLGLGAMALIRRRR